ncbi:conserved hypothetical protein [Trichinella spiralis]|uniref:hypothetical protein n=1 Tax=Trichinella spiralis TaxID=6334 RepID=UPI0001EFD53A|nr:conserved hypothetical protein [Trichinella spiralis]
MPFHDLVDCIYTLYKHWPASQARRPVATVLISVQLDQPMIQSTQTDYKLNEIIILETTQITLLRNLFSIPAHHYLKIPVATKHCSWYKNNDCATPVAPLVFLNGKQWNSN